MLHHEIHHIIEIHFVIANIANTNVAVHHETLDGRHCAERAFQFN